MIYINTACTVQGSQRRKVVRVLEDEGLSAIMSEEVLKNLSLRTVSCVPNWSFDEKCSIIEKCVGKAIDNANILPDEINRMYFSCTMPMTHLPIGKSLLKLALKNIKLTAPYFHIAGHQCSGVVACVGHAYRSMSLDPSLERILILTADFIDFSSRRTLGNGVFQGDAASAIILSREAKGLLYVGSHIVSDPGLYEMSGVSKNNEWQYFFKLRSLVNNLITEHALSVKDINYIIPHLSQISAWERIRKMIGYDGEILLLDKINTVGHLFGSDLTLGLELLLKRKLKKQQNILALTYGMGASWGGMLLKSA